VSALRARSQPDTYRLAWKDVMETRRLGRTGLQVSVLGFGCGAVGGLMVRGSPADQERAVAHATELGITFFDTAPLYGNGESEKNLGRVLATLKHEVVVGTKVRIGPGERGDIARAVATSLEASLKRLRRDSVDLFQLHNPIGPDADGEMLNASAVLDEVMPAFERLHQQGKIRSFGITALGATQTLRQVIDANALDTAQVAYNVLNPSAGNMVPEGYPGQDYGNLLHRTREADMGVINIRVLAGGALTGTEVRHPLGMPSVEPIGSGSNYAADVRRAQRLHTLVQEGHATSLVELGLRFAIAHPAIGTVLVGYSTLEHLELAAAAINKGPLAPDALQRLTALQNSFAGEPR
jgi:aryl-alcohol dehydrogenase-like predicted oxidoreductase